MTLMRPQLLVVEDHEDLVQMLETVLGRRGYDVRPCRDGLSGRAELLTGFYDVCLLDIDIPRLNGREVLEAYRAAAGGLDTVVVVMTAGADIASAVDCMRLGAVDYLPKPFRLEELELCLQKALRTRRLLIENRRWSRFLLEEVSRKTEELKKTFLGVVQAFAESLTYRDQYTGGHSRRVSDLAVLFARQLGWPEKKLQEVRVGGLLHDLGKVGVDDRILRKQGQLTPDEFEAIRRHPRIGYDIIGRIEAMQPLVPYVLHHHERWDGTGYPSGLKAEEIPIEARLICLSDALDAMRSRRSYRSPLGVHDMLEEVERNSGTQFDPDLVRLFFQLWTEGALESLIGEAAA